MNKELLEETIRIMKEAKEYIPYTNHSLMGVTTGYIGPAESLRQQANKIEAQERFAKEYESHVVKLEKLNA